MSITHDSAYQLQHPLPQCVHPVSDSLHWVLPFLFFGQNAQIPTVLVERSDGRMLALLFIFVAPPLSERRILLFLGQ